MKKGIIMLWASALLCLMAGITGCNNAKQAKTASGNGQEKNMAASPQVLTFDSIGTEQSDSIVEVKLSVQYPVSGPQVLVDSIRRYIAETLIVDQQWANDRDSLLAIAARKGYSTMKADRDEMIADGIRGVPPFYYSFDITKNCETDKYITMNCGYEEFRGGPHGSFIATATTIRKSDGKRMGWSMLTKTDTPEFRKLMIKGVRQYFEESGEKVESDEQLKDMLIIEGSVSNLPLPQAEPSLTPKGVAFCYQQYEIAAYAVGLPSFTISYADIRPYLTDEALELIK
ncbi:MAG: DUF3298 domain-containing protein [Prevotella sp.]|nr:DUF3298 domain-containing protein [Prevotella sp.]